VRAVFRVTNRCNIRCIHCYLYSHAVEMPNFRMVKNARSQSTGLPASEILNQAKQLDADSDSIFKAIDELMDMGTRIFQFSGGEAFLHKDILNFVTCVKTSGGYCTVNTNGTLLIPDLIDELIDLRFDGFRITTMAGDAGMYAVTHPGIHKKMFEALTANLYYIKDRKKFLRIKKPKVALAFVIIRENVDEILNFARFAVNVKADSVEYRPINYHSDQGLACFTPHKEQITSIKKQLTEAKKILELHGIDHDIDKLYKVFSLRRDTSELYKHIPCYLGWISIHIETDGGVYPCCGGMVPFDKISNQSVKDIWCGDKYTNFRKEAISINKRKKLVQNCDCDHCGNFSANMNLYKIFHPIKYRRRDFRD
ncbi:MAG: radical SAM protein, partial [Desulfobacterales bacterium]|nr:radical SAM protein [Desulfobacterales bacterium]